MSNFSSITPLDYAAPATSAQKRDRLVCRCGAIAALLLAIYPSFSLGAVLVMLAADRSFLGGFTAGTLFGLIELATGPMLIACVVLVWRGNRDVLPILRIKQTFTVTAVFLVLVRLAELAIAAGRAASITATLVWSIPKYASLVALFMPPLLLGVSDVQRWRRRLCGLATVAMLLSGVGGISALMSKAQFIEQKVGGTMAQAVQVALRDPAPIVGLWPAAGFAAAVLFAIAIARSGVTILSFAIALAVAFKAEAASFAGVTSVLRSLADRDMFWGNVIVLDSILTTNICDLLPAGLIMWMLWRERDEFLLVDAESLSLER